MKKKHRLIGATMTFSVADGTWYEGVVKDVKVEKGQTFVMLKGNKEWLLPV